LCFGRDEAKEVQRLLESVGNKPTPLVELKGLNQLLGIKGLFVKDESKRLEI